MERRRWLVGAGAAVGAGLASRATSGSEEDGRDYYEFAPVLLTTLIQGIVMNVVLMVYGAVVLALMGVVSALTR